MGAGLSMASVNKIKELANSREYSLALELVEHQDLSKSLNPQFLRLCGEIYIKNNRYEDARRCLIMAHRLAPESKRIMYVFVELYLRMGYFELAKTYYDMYMFDAGSCDSRQMEYVWTKHEHPDALKDMEQLLASYMHNLDYDWSFELYLVYKKEEKKEEAHSLAELYAASFKNSENSDRICAIEKGKESADVYFDVYASVEQKDNDERYDALRSEEAELLAADDLRMHPKEAEITVMYEDAFTPAGSEKKVQKMLKKQDREEERKEKKLLKEQRKQEKKLEKQAAKADGSEEETTLEASATEETKPETVAETVEETKPETAVETAEEMKPETAVETAETVEETKPETAVETAAEETKPEAAVETAAEETKPEMAVEATAEKEIKPETAGETAEKETKPEAAGETAEKETKPETAGDAVVEKEEIEEPEIEKSKKRGLFSKIFRKKKEVEDDTTEYAELVQTSESEIIDAEQDDRPSENPDAEKAAETEVVHAESETDSNETIDTMTTGQADDMRHKSKTMAKNVVVVDDDNDFEAEADTIEELVAKEKSDVEKKIEGKKTAFEFQTVELAPDDFEDQFQVDDFSDKLDAEFGEMKSYEPEPTIEIEVEEPEAEAEEPEVEPELEIEEPEAEEPEVEIEEPELEAEEPEVEIEEPEVEVEEPEAEEPEEEIEEPEADGSESIIEELEVEEPEVEIEEPEVEPEPESIIEESETEPELEIEEPEVEIEEPEVEPEPIIEESETEPELEIEEPEVESEPEPIIEESETEPELEIEESEVETEEPEIEEPEVESEPEAEEPEFRVAPFTTKPEKKKLDFPVFKSSLFPDYHKEVKNVENNFDEIMEEAQDKMTENMRKEAQMQKEAEELLASLGISLNSIPAPAVKEEQPGQQGPSRDELKASLKIDTNKKNLLKRIKEYR